MKDEAMVGESRLSEGREPLLCFGSFVFDQGRAELRNAAGSVVALRPKTRALLEYLLSHAGRVAPRDAILDAVWPGVTVGDESLSQAVAELRRTLGAPGARLIRTVPRLGYLMELDDAVERSQQARRASSSPMSAGQGPGMAIMPGRHPRWDGPAVAVLPFDVLGHALHDRWRADGLADDLITALGSWGWFPVIARQSSFSYRGTPSPARRIAEELGAAYLVEGTLRRAAKRLRVTIRLVDGSTGRQIWAGESERSVMQLFDARDDLLAEIAGQLEVELAHAEAGRAAAIGSAKDLDAYLTVQRARWHQSRGGPEHAAEARRLLRSAIAMDPGYAPAWGGLARATAVAAEMGWTNEPRREVFAEALDLAHEAVRVDSRCCDAWYSLGEVHLLAEVGWDTCLASFEQALARNPSHVAARARLTTPLACTGRPAEAVRATELAMRLSPRDPRTFIWLSGLAVAHHMLGNYEAAVAAARRSLLLRPDWAPAHHPLAVSLARLGKREEAAEVFRRLRELEPDAIARTEHFARGFHDEAAGRHWREGMRIAASGS